MEQAVDSGSAKVPMVAAMGEALVDMIELPSGHFQPCLGGSVCNFAIGLARQGVPTTYLNPLSADSFGRRFNGLFSDSGVQLANPQASSLPTSIAVVSVDGQGVASYAFHRECVADRDVSAQGLIENFPAQLELLHTGGLALVPDDLAKTLQVVDAAKAGGALVSIDANVRLVAVGRKQEYLDGVKHALAHAHIVKASDEDLAHLGAADDSIAEARRLCLANGTTRLLALTRGSKGAALVTRDCFVELPTPTGLQVVDTVGAGDCFHAGLLAWLHRSGSLDAQAIERLDIPMLRAALEHAIAAASINVTRAGCDPATWDETRRYLYPALP
jgi:fructokinase